MTQRIYHFGLLFVVLAMTIGGVAQSDALQAETAAPKKAAPSTTTQAPPAFLTGPGKTLVTFIKAMSEHPVNFERAISALELKSGETNTAVNQTRAQRIFSYLQQLGYTAEKNPGVPDTLDDDTFSLLPAPTGASKLTTQRADQFDSFSNDSAFITLAKQTNGAWRFSAATIADDNLAVLRAAELQLIQADPSARTDLATRSLEGWLLVNTPDSLHGQFLFIMMWQWIGLGILIFIGLLLDQIFRLIFKAFLRRWIGHILGRVAGSKEIDPIILKRSGRAFGVLVATIIWRIGLDFLFLPISAYAMFSVGADAILVLAGIWTASRVVDLLAEVCAHRASSTDSKLDDLLVPLIRKTGKFVVIIIGAVYFANAINLEISPLLAGLGIGGLGFAFAAQNSIENFFGSLTVLLDKPFQVGDWVVVGDVEGTVHSVGMRSTRVRTFYDSLVTLPNSMLVNTQVNNYGQRSFRRWSTRVGLLYETTPEQVEAFCEGARELVRQQPYMRRENYQIFLNEFGDSGIEILIYVFWRAPDWATELRERHRFMLSLMRLAGRLGVSFAYPTQTVYLSRSPSIPTTPTDLGTKQTQEQAEAFGRAAARELMADQSWTSHPNRTPPPFRYDSATETLAIDEGKAAPTHHAPTDETRGSAGEGS